MKKLAVIYHSRDMLRTLPTTLPLARKKFRTSRFISSGRKT